MIVRDSEHDDEMRRLLCQIEDYRRKMTDGTFTSEYKTFKATFIDIMDIMLSLAKLLSCK